MFDASDADMALAPLPAEAEAQLTSWEDLNLPTLANFLSISTPSYSRYNSTASLLSLGHIPQAETRPSSLFSLSTTLETADSQAALQSLPAQLQPLNLVSAMSSVSAFLTAQVSPAVSPVPDDGETLDAVMPIALKPTPDGTVQDWAAIAQVRVIPSYLEPEDSTLASGWLARCTDLPASARIKEVSDPDSFPRYRVWFKDHALGDVSDADQAERLAQELRQLLQREEVDPSLIQPDLDPDQPGVKLGDEMLFTIEDQMAEVFGFSTPWMAVAWANNLRVALGAPPLDAGSVQMALHDYEPSEKQLKGTASWYGPYFHGRQTATGETFNQNALTVAHKTLPFGTLLKVRNRQTGRTVVVRVNDRGPYIGKRSLDLSKAAAQCLGSEKKGVIPYDAEILQKAEPDGMLTLRVNS
ncbi:MAG: septal ring lytic transglycosylase RlpA family protein [Cyanobacteria bacterium P01_G01_bin.38]